MSQPPKMNLPPHLVSPQLKSFIEKNLPAENISIIIKSHLDLKGNYSSTWLCLTDHSLFIIEENGSSPTIYHQTKLVNIKSISNVSLKGGGLMVYQTLQGTKVDLLRYPDSQGFLFASVIDRINRYGKHEKFDLEKLKISLKEIYAEEINHFCSKCYRPFDTNTKICDFCVDKKKMLRRVLQFAYPYRYQYIILICLMGLGTLIQILPSIITGKIIDHVIGEQKHDLLIPLLAGLFCAMLGSTITHILHARLGVKIGSRITASIRQKTYDHLQSLSLKYFDKQETGALMNRVSADAQSMQSFLVEGVQYSIYNILLITVITITLLRMNPVIGAIILVPIPLVVYISKKCWKNIYSHFRKYWDASALMHAYLSDSLSGIKEIKTTGQEDTVREKFSKKNMLTTERSILAERSWQTLIPFLNLTIQSSLLMVWYFGAGDVIKSLELNDKSFTTGNLVTMVGLMGLMFGPLQLLTRLNDWVARALSAAERIFEILDTKPQIEDAEKPHEIKNITGNITFDDVVFGYDKHKPVINHLSLNIKPGEMIGFVGKSGVGKSTLMKLMLRLYDVDSGIITIDGVNIKDIRREVLNTNISVVMQDTFLFNGSIADNISFSKPNASKLEIINAAMLANAHDFIMKLPNGYDAYVGERGTKLSGGERQRIAIARALISNPKILILDEATASVDTETEQKIQQALQRLIKGRTTLAIAHRLSTLRNADRLYVIEKGDVKETGTHDELMQLENGIYKNLVTIQTEWARNVFVGG